MYRNLGRFRFEDITEQAGLVDPEFWGTGAVMVDVDGDGDLDIHACGYRSPNRVWINSGTDSGGVPTFKNEAERMGLVFNGASMSAAFADYDRDGDLDMYLATTAAPPPAGTQFRVEFEGGRPVIPEDLREYWALVYLPNEKAHRTEAGQFDRLFRNDNGKFVDVTKAAGIDGPFFTLGVVWWDFDHDGWPDLYVSNDYLGPDRLYRNQRDGTFREIIRDTIPHTPWSSMGMDIGDLNNDGLLDIITTDMLGSSHYRRNVMQGEVSKTGWFLDIAEPRQYTRNAVLLNTGTSRMLEVAYLTGMAATDWTWAPLMEDLDGDGRTDVFFTNGMLRDVQHADFGNYADKMLGAGSPRWAKFWAEQPLLNENNRVFRNRGGLQFEETGTAWGLDRKGVSFGTAAADFDGDGDVDLAVNNVDAPISLYENRSHAGNTLRLRLRGGGKNTHGLGSTVRIQTESGRQVRYLTSTRGWLSGSEPVVSFGLGENNGVATATIQWPDGSVQALGPLMANHFYEIRQPDAGKPVDQAVAHANDTTQRFFEPSEELAGISDVLSSHDDFLTQPLLPFRFSRSRFCMAWGDVDGDGRQDLFVGGGVGHSGQVYLQKEPGQYQLQSGNTFLTAQLHADVDAVFVDVDGDKDLDLFVVSGGAEIPASATTLFQSRLYLNDGTGAFQSVTEDSLPRMTSPGSCVAVGDVDGDGRPDLFVGGGAINGRYPEAAPSVLLINEGGRFRIANGPTMFSRMGLVRAAALADLNGDSTMDLVVACDWGPVRVFVNEDGKLVDATEEAGLAGRTGWWRSLALSDVDHDGDIDIVAGNLGRNTRHSPTLTAPDRLYFGPFGNNGSNLVVEAYHENGSLYPRRGFDQLSRLNLKLREKFLNFHQYSEADIVEIFDGVALQAALQREVNTAESGLWLNDGNAKFEFSPLPVEAQVSSVNSIGVMDFNDDGHSDLVLAQNDFTPDKLMGRIDGGLSLLLQGDGRGGFAAVGARRSGLVIPEEARRVRVVDVDSDGKLDLVFGVPGGALQSFLRTTD